MESSMPGVAVDAPVWLLLHGSSAALHVGGQVSFLERKSAALLAYLHCEGQTPRARLAGLLWPETSGDGARGNLRQCLARLRKLSVRLLADADGLLSIAPGVTVAPPPSLRSPLLGSFQYADCEEFARWLDWRQQSEQSLHRASVVADFKAAKLSGDLERAQQCADALLALDRESEDSYRLLMEVAYLRGDFATAIALWNRCRDMLRELYGVPASSVTNDLAAMVLSAARATEGRRAATASAIPLSLLRPPRLIARNAELASMFAAWRAGDLVCICGEAGIGKSRLLAEFAAVIGPCVRVAAQAGDAVQPFASLNRLAAAAIDRFCPAIASDRAHWVARLLPAAASLVPGQLVAPLQTDRERVLALHALRGLFADCMDRGCKALILDDLQYADRATIEALPELVAPLADHWTSDDPGSTAPRFAFASRLEKLDSPVTALLSAWSSNPQFMRLDLAPLPASGIRELIASLELPLTDNLPARLEAKVGGNPAFVLESIKLLISLGESQREPQSLPVPRGIEAVIQQRIELLSAPARHIAQLAAIAGGGYTVAMAAEALACPVFALTEPLRELEMRQVLAGRQFVHDVVASAVQRSIPAAVAEFMHRFVAEHMESHGGDPALIASHWDACGDAHRAGLCYLRAAVAAQAAVRLREQAEFLDAAADCFLRSGSNDDLFNALDQRLDVESVADRVTVRGGLVTRLESLARTEEQQVRALLHRISIAGEHAQSLGLVELNDGLRRSRALRQNHLAFKFCEPIATHLALQGQFDAALSLTDSFLPWAESQTDLRLRGQLLRTFGVVHGLCDRLLPAIEYFERANAEFSVAGDDLGRLPTLSNIGLMRHWRGELEAARTTLNQASALRDRLHGSGAALVIESNLAAVLRDLGEFKNANDRFEDISAQWRSMQHGSDEPPTDLVVVENHQAQLWLLLGQPTRALECLRADDTRTDSRFRARRIALRLRAARMEGRDARSLGGAAVEVCAELTSEFNRVLFELEWFRGLPAAEAAKAFASLFGRAAIVQRPALRVHTAVRAAQARMAAGEHPDALEWAEFISGELAMFEPFDMDPVEAWLTVYDVLRHNHQTTAAGQALSRGMEKMRQNLARLPLEWHSSYARLHRGALGPAIEV
ncbi:MAG: AAA family ATPase [Pseudomonadota bacterium]|nr:AAA family ATPase [Pseudomonadota bacterium]